VKESYEEKESKKFFFEPFLRGPIQTSRLTALSHRGTKNQKMFVCFPQRLVCAEPHP